MIERKVVVRHKKEEGGKGFREEEEEEVRGKSENRPEEGKFE